MESINDTQKRKASHDCVEEGENNRKRGCTVNAIEDLLATIKEYMKNAEERCIKAEIREKKQEKRAERVEGLLGKLVKNTAMIANKEAEVSEFLTSGLVEDTLERSSESLGNSNKQQQQQQAETNKNDVTKPREEKWMAMFQELREYRIKNGHCKVSRTKDPKLGTWVKSQREAYATLEGNTRSNRKLTPDQILKLDSLGFWWGEKYRVLPSFDEIFEQLQRYQQAMGNCNVPMNNNNPTLLAKIVSFQRSEFEHYTKGCKSLLTLKQFDKLTKIGMDWNGPRLCLPDRIQIKSNKTKTKTSTNNNNNTATKGENKDCLIEI